MPSSVQFMGDSGVATLRKHIDTIIAQLPSDLSQSILNTPHNEKLMTMGATATTPLSTLVGTPPPSGASLSIQPGLVTDDAL